MRWKRGSSVAKNRTVSPSFTSDGAQVWTTHSVKGWAWILNSGSSPGRMPDLLGPTPLGTGDPPLPNHEVEDEPRSLMSPLPRGLLERIEAGGCLDHPGQQGRLVQVEILGLLAEVVPARPVKADDLASAELDLVEIGREQFLLADGAVERAGMPDLGSLPLELAEHVAPLQIMKHEVLQELHRDRAAAPAQAAAKHGRQRDEVDAAVVHVALVLDGDDGLLHRLRDLVGREHDRTAAIRIPTRRGPGDHDLRGAPRAAEGARA